MAKHAKVQTATITVNVTTAHDEGERLNISVSDAGAGFNPDKLAANNGRGGFGLLSVRERLGYLGGSMSVVSTPGNGTVVTLSVPLLEEGLAAVEAPTKEQP